MADAVTEKNHDFVRQCVKTGDVADFTAREGFNVQAKPTIEAAFLRRLLLGLEGDARALMPGVRIRGAMILGALDLEDCSGAGDVGLPAFALELCDIPDPIFLNGAKMARFSMAASRFRAVWAEGAKINGGFDFSEAGPYPTGGEGLAPAFLWLDRIRLDGNLRGDRAVLNRSAEIPHALSAEGAHIRGAVLLRAGFTATGTIWLLNAEILGGLNCIDGAFNHGEEAAIVATNARIGADVSFSGKFAAQGKVVVQAAKIGGDIDCTGGRFYGADDRALIAENTEVEGDVLLRDKFSALGKVTLAGAVIKRDLVIRDAEVIAKESWALSLRTMEVGGLLTAYGNSIGGPVDLSGSKINRLIDDPGSAWGDGKHAVVLDELSYTHLGALPGARRPLYLSRVPWLKRNTGPRFGATTKDLVAFSNQPWRECAAAFQRAGLHQDARRIAREEQREANRHRAWWKRPFVWLFAEQSFGYGLSVMRATVTSLLFWGVGCLGAQIMLERGALIDADKLPGPARACTDISPPLYALDVSIPVLDLKHEDECKPGRAPGAKLHAGVALPWGLGMFGEEVAVWRWLKTLYAIFGAAAIGMTLLTFTGIFKPKAQE